MCRRSTFGSLGVAVLTLLVLPGETWPQEQPATPPPLTVGSRVRLWAPTVGEGRIEGVVHQVDDRSLSILREGKPASVPREAITRFEVGTGRHSQVWKGLGIGAGVGALVGGVSGCFPMVGCGGDVDQHLGAALFGAVGFAGWGALIGAFVQTDRWQAVPVERVHVALAATRGGGFALRVAYSF